MERGQRGGWTKGSQRVRSKVGAMSLTGNTILEDCVVYVVSSDACVVAISCGKVS